MGMIHIDTVGSFSPRQSKQFSAIGGGHAQAVADAIKWPAEMVMPAAIVQDHLLQSEGAYPENGFGLPAGRRGEAKEKS